MPSNEDGVRCAACLLAKQIFAVIGASFSTLVGGIVLDVYRALKKVVNDPLSSKWLYNDAALALESVDDAVKDYLTPSNKMEKKIQIWAWQPVYKKKQAKGHVFHSSPQNRD